MGRFGTWWRMKVCARGDVAGGGWAQLDNGLGVCEAAGVGPGGGWGAAHWGGELVSNGGGA